jgi:hypothetical protein
MAEHSLVRAAARRGNPSENAWPPPKFGGELSRGGVVEIGCGSRMAAEAAALAALVDLS